MKTRVDIVYGNRGNNHNRKTKYMCRDCEDTQVIYLDMDNKSYATKKSKNVVVEECLKCRKDK